NWLPLTFRLDGGEWFDLDRVEILEYRQELDMRRGVLTRRVRFRDKDGRTSVVTQRRFASMDDPHVVALDMTIVAEDWSGTVDIRAGLDGTVTNSGVARYRDLAGNHLRPVVEGADGERTMWLQVETSSSKIRIAEVARLTVTGVAARGPAVFERSQGWVSQTVRLDLREGESATVEKVVTIFTSLDLAVTESLETAIDHLRGLDDFATLLGRHVLSWAALWRTCRVAVPGDVQQLLNLHMFHLLQTMSEHSADLDVGVPARGLHGEAYRGHVFWDELFVFPF